MPHHTRSQTREASTITEVYGKLCSLDLNTSNKYVALIERLDTDTVCQHRFLELQVSLVAVDQILALKGSLDPLVFEVKDGQIIKVRRPRTQ
jgi:hypothetical protein